MHATNADGHRAERRRERGCAGPGGHRVPLLDVLDTADDEVLERAGPGQGVDDPDRPGHGRRRAGDACARRATCRADRWPTRPSGWPSSAAGPATSARWPTTTWGTPTSRTCGPPAWSSSRTSAGSHAGDAARHGPLHGAHLRGRRAHHGHVPGGGVHPDPEGRAARLRGAGGGRPARGLPVGRASGQGGHAPRRRHGHEADGSVALSLSDPFCVARHQREFLDLLLDDVDILLGNEEEITMLFGATSPAGAARGRRGDRPPRRHDRGRAGLRGAHRARPRRGAGGAGRPGGGHHRRRRPLRGRFALRPDPWHGPGATAPASGGCAPPR